jgi:TolB protein
MSNNKRWFPIFFSGFLFLGFLYACASNIESPTPNRILITGTIGTETAQPSLSESSTIEVPQLSPWPSLELTLLPTIMPSMPAGNQPTIETYPPQNGFYSFAAWSGSRRRVWLWSDGFSQPFAVTPAEEDAHDPEISHDGQRIAFTSHRDGKWNIFVLNIKDGVSTQLTHVSDYAAHPTWSPDSQYIAYEHFTGGHFQLCIIPTSGSDPNWCGPSILDSYEPHWAAQGRIIVFTGREAASKQSDIYSLDLNSMALANITNTGIDSEDHPVISPDGSRVAYAVHKSGYTWIETISLDPTAHLPTIQVQGDWPVWNAEGTWLAGIYQPQSSESYFLFYPSDHSTAYPPAKQLAARVDRISWGAAPLPNPLPQWLQNASTDVLAAPIASPTFGGPQSHKLTSIAASAPDPRLSDAVLSRFTTMRTDLTTLAGWDYLATLDSAVVAIATPLAPGDQLSWLRTGRAIAIARDAMLKGWLLVVPESRGSYTYWRVYLKTTRQDGTQGEPVRDFGWDFSARTSTDPAAVTQGGMTKPTTSPDFYIDLTQIFAAHGWEREPADANWRSFYPGIRYWEFVCRDGLDWYQAMNEIYPLNAYLTATPSNTPTPWPTYNWGPRPTDTRWPSPTLKYP